MDDEKRGLRVEIRELKHPVLDQHGDTVLRVEIERSAMVYAEVLTVDRPTRNGRTYPREVFQKAMEAYQGCIKEQRAFGTLYNEARSPHLALHCASHVTTAMTMDEKGVVHVQLQTLQTPAGQAITALLACLDTQPSDPMEVRVVPYGMGTIRDDGLVGEDYLLLAFDFVLYQACKHE